MAEQVFPPPQRLFAGLLALIGWVALAFQVVLTTQLILADGGTVLGGIWRFLGYFTLLTNILVALTMSLIWLRRWPGGQNVNASVITGVVLAISVVGLVYHFVLSGRGPELSVLRWTIDRVLHYLVPSMAVLFWVLFVPKKALGWCDPFFWVAYPLSYLTYALLRGAIDNWYPYFFIDVSVIGYRASLINAAMLSLVILLAGFVVLGAAKLLKGQKYE